MTYHVSLETGVVTLWRQDGDSWFGIRAGGFVDWEAHTFGMRVPSERDPLPAAMETVTPEQASAWIDAMALPDDWRARLLATAGGAV